MLHYGVLSCFRQQRTANWFGFLFKNDIPLLIFFSFPVSRGKIPYDEWKYKSKSALVVYHSDCYSPRNGSMADAPFEGLLWGEETCLKFIWFQSARCRFEFSKFVICSSHSDLGRMMLWYSFIMLTHFLTFGCDYLVVWYCISIRTIFGNNFYCWRISVEQLKFILT